MRISDWSSDVCSSDLPERVHALLVDIDHTPRHVLHPSHAPFYTAEGLSRVVERLHPGGVFALWSDDPPDDDFMAVLDELFHTAEAYVVTFPNFHNRGDASNTVYLASTERQQGSAQRADGLHLSVGVEHARVRTRYRPRVASAPGAPIGRVTVGASVGR